MNHPYVYVIVRTDLTIPQQAVQSSHAVLEMTRQHDPQIKVHPSIIILGVNNEKKLKNWITKLVNHGKIRFTPFQEPARNDEYTAIATEPISGQDREFFAKLQLIKGCK